MSHRDTDQPRVDRDLRDQLVRENGLTPYYINDAERQDREAAREWLNENVFDWDLPEHEIQLASEGSGGGGYWDGSMPVRIHTFDGECNGYRSGNRKLPPLHHRRNRPSPPSLLRPGGLGRLPDKHHQAGLCRRQRERGWRGSR